MKHRLLSLLFACCIAAAGFSAVPYSLNESFESGIPSSWSQEVLSAEQELWAIDAESTYPTGAYDGEHRVALRNSTDAEKHYITRLITPVLDLSAVYSPQLSFAYAQQARTGMHDTLVVYYRLTSASDWVELCRYNDATTGWTPVTIGLVATQGQATSFQLAFEARENMGRGVVLDNVRIYPESRCTDAEITGVIPGSTSATIIWQGDLVRSYELIIDTVAISDLDTYDTSKAVDYQPSISGLESVVNGLTSATHYYAYLRSDCDDNESGHTAWVSAEFTTSIGYPYAPELTSAKLNSDWERKTGAVAPTVDGSTLSSGTGWSYTANATVTGKAHYYGCPSYVSYSVGYSPSWLISPEIDMTEADVNAGLSFLLALTSGSTSTTASSYRLQSSLWVMVSDDQGATWTLLDSIAGADMSNTPTRFSLSLTNYVGAPLKVAFVAKAPSSSAYFHLDDVRFADLDPACLGIQNLNVAPAAEEVVLTWTVKGTNNNAIAVISTHANFSDTLEMKHVSSPTATFTGLTPQTTYYVSVRQDCETEDVLKTSFKTSCSVVSTFPWVENFNSLTSGIPDCWDNSEGTTTSSSYKWTYHSTGNTGRCVRFDSYNNSNGNTNFLATPSFLLTQDSYLSFYWKNPTGGAGEVLISTDGGATKTSLFSKLTGVSSWTKFNVDLSAYTGQTVIIYFKGTSNYGSGDAYLDLDDVSVIVYPNCRDMGAVTVASVRENGVTFDFASTGAPQYQLVIAKASITPDSLNVDTNVVYKALIATTNQIVLDTAVLEPSTSYYAYIRSYCSADEQGAWSGEIVFKTACLSIDIDNFGVEKFGNADALECWTTGVITTGDNHSYVYAQRATSNLYGAYLKLSRETSTATYDDEPFAVTPKLEFTTGDIRNYQVVFSAGTSNTSATNLARLNVGIVSEPNTLEGIRVLKSIVLPYASDSSKLQNYTVSFTSYGGDDYGEFGQYVIFYAAGVTTHDSTNYVVLDNISFEPAASCEQIIETSVDTVTPIGAVLSWENTGGLAYQVMLASVDTQNPDAISEPIKLVEVQTNSVVFDDLNSNTLYFAYVRSICGAGDTAQWSNSFSFQTTQMPVAVPFSDDFEGGNNWIFVNGTTNNWAWGTATNNGGTHALYISNDGGVSNAYDNTAATIVFATKAVELTKTGSYTFKYDWLGKGESSYDYLRVAIVPFTTELTAGTTPSSFGTSTLPSGWIALDGGSKLNGSEVWQTVSQEVRLTAGLYKVVLAWKDDTSTGDNPPAAVDNFSIEVIACPKATGLAVDSVVSDSARLYVNDLDAAGYHFVVASAQIELDSLSASDAAKIVFNDSILGDTAIHVNGLRPATNYYAYARTICDNNEHGAWSAPVSFASACNAITVADGNPFIENFNGLKSGIPICWDNSRGTVSSTYRWNYYATGYEGACLRFNSYTPSSGTTDTLVTPEIHLAEDAILSFYWKNGAGGAAAVLISADGGATFTTLESALTSKSSWTLYEKDLSEYTGQTVQIYFASTSNWGSGDAYHYLDNVKIAAVPSCLPATGVVIDNTATDSARIRFDKSGDATYDIVVASAELDMYHISAADSAKIAFSADAYADTVLFANGLQPATVYYTYVRVNCGSSSSEWSEAVAFTTDCNMITAFPWSEDFENLPKGTSASKAPLCWNLLNANDGKYPYIYVNTSSPYVHGGSQSLYFQSSDVRDGYIVMPEFDQVNNLQVTFYYKHEDASKSGRLYLGYMTDVDNASTFAPIAELERSASWAFATVGTDVIPDSLVGVARLAIKYGKQSSNYYMGIDDITVKILPQCQDIQSIGVDGITATSAKISFAATSANNYHVLVAAAAINPDSLSTVPDSLIVFNVATLDTNVCNVSSLQPQTTYYVYVRGICGDTNGAWSAAVPFTTACAAVEVPYAMDFEAESSIPQCWNMVLDKGSSAGAYISTSSSYAHSGTHALVWGTSYTSTTQYRSWVVLPEVEDSVNKLELSFYMRMATPYGSSYYEEISDSLIIGVMNGPADTASFVRIDAVMPTSATYEQVKIDFSAYAGNGKYIAILRQPLGEKNSSNGYRYGYSYDYYYCDPAMIDDINLHLLPACREVRDLTVKAQSDSVDFAFTATSAPLYQAVLTAIAIDPDTLANVADSLIIANMDTLTSGAGHIGNLVPQTTYYLYVRALCDPASFSEWVETSFTTSCAPLATLPWTEGFEDYEGTTYSSNGEVPNCWIVGGTSSVKPHVIGSGSYYYVHEGTKSLTFYGSGYCYAALPEFAAPINTLQISFWMQTESSTNGKLTLGYISAGDVNMSTFTPIEEYANSYDSMTQRETYLSNVPDSAARLVFCWYYSSQWSCCIDDIEISLLPECQTPSAIGISADAHEADIVWTGNAENYEVAFGAVGFNLPAGADSIYAVADTAFLHIDGLTPSTSYDVYVRAKCDDALFSAWSKVSSFSTACLKPIGTTYDFDDVSSRYVTYSTYEMENCWNAIYTSTSYIPNIVTNSESSSYSYSGESALRLYTYGSSYKAAAVMPLVDADMDTVKIRFMGRAGSAYTSSTSGTVSMSSASSSNACAVKVGTLTDPTDLSTFQLIKECMGVTTSADPANDPEGTEFWRQFDINLMGAAGKYVAFVSDYSLTNYFYIDDVQIMRGDACPAPIAPVVKDIQKDAARVEFTPTNAPVYAVMLKQGNDTIANVLVGSDSARCSFSGLLEATVYSVAVRALCDSNEVSPWSEATFFTTDCDVKSVPWSEGFEALSVGNSSSPAPLCWNLIGANEGNYPYIYVNNSSLYVQSGSKSLYFVSSSSSYGYAVLPAFDSINTLQIKFSYKDESTSSSGRLFFGYLTDAADSTTFIAIAEAPRSTSWQTVVYELNTIPESAASARLAFKYGGASNNYYLGIDDISVKKLSNCLKPVNVDVKDIGTNEATIFFPSTGADAYEVIVAKAAIANLDEMTSADSANIVFSINQLTDTSIVVDDLSANTAYFAYVRGLCGSEASDWSDKLGFRTECGVITAFPYRENFDNSADRQRTDAYVLPTCWSEGHDSIDYVSSIFSNGYTSSYDYYYTFAQSGYYALGMLSNDRNATRAVLPMLVSDMALKLSFDARAMYKYEYDDYDYYEEGVANFASSSYAHAVKVGLMSDPADKGTFELLEEVVLTEYESVSDVTSDPNGKKYWESFTVDIPDAAGKYIVLMSDFARENIIFIDNIVVEEYNASCPSLDSISVSGVSLSGATINFALADSVTGDVRIVVSKQPSIDEATAVLVDTVSGDNTYVINNGLEASTTYYVFAQLLCDNDQVSSAINTSFTTAYGIRYEPIFTSTILPSDWIRAKGSMDGVIAGMTKLSIGSSSSWYVVAGDTVIDKYHFRGDVYGSSFNDWVITPAIDLTPNVGDGILLTLDAGLTPYSSYYADVRNDGTDDRFAVLVTADDGQTWTKIAEWNNAGTGEFIYNDIPEHGTSYQLNLTNFAGQVVRVAFYAESTVSNADNYLHFGNIVIDKCAAVNYQAAICDGDDYDGSQDNNPFYIPADMYKIGTNVFSDYRPSTGAGDADSMLVLTLIVHEYFSTDLYVTLCEGAHYGPDENGFDFDAEVGMADKRVRYTSSLGCDSLVTLHITVTPKITVHIEDSVARGEAYVWNGAEYYVAGTYEYTTTSEVTGCDSTTVLHLSVYQREEAIPSVQAQSLLIAPNPVKAGEPIQVLTSFTADELANAHIEIVSATGALVYVQHGADEPFILPGLPISGVYVVRIRIDDAIYISSLLVK